MHFRGRIKTRRKCSSLNKDWAKIYGHFSSRTKMRRKLYNIIIWYDFVKSRLLRHSHTVTHTLSNPQWEQSPQTHGTVSVRIGEILAMCHGGGVSLVLFWLVRWLWRKFVILLSSCLVVVAYVMHGRDCVVVTLREFPGLAGFPSPPSFS